MSVSGPIVFHKMHDHALLPVRATTHSSAFDLFADTDAVFSPMNARKLIGTGIRLEMPRDHVALVCTRSGYALKHGLFVLNAPGVIDPDYTDEIKVIMAWLPSDYHWPEITEAKHVMRGDRIAQLLILPNPVISDFANNISSPRTGGFGSTNVNN